MFSLGVQSDKATILSTTERRTPPPPPPQQQTRRHRMMRCTLFLSLWSAVLVFFVMHSSFLNRSLLSLSSTRTIVIRNDAIQVNDTHASFLAPIEPDSLPTAIMRRALVPKNATHATPTNLTELSSCPVTSQVRLIVQDHQYWILESVDVYGNRKLVGGDEYYITYTDHSIKTVTRPTAIAFVRDLQDGSYSLRFVTSPSRNASLTMTGSGTVSIVLQYSCGIGHLAPPAKENWSTGGAISRSYFVGNVTAPRMEPFVPPRGDINLGIYDQVVAYGDSTMGHFAAAGRNLVWPAGNIGAPLNMDTIKKPRERKGVVSPSMIDQIKHHVTNAMKNHSKVALIMGSGVWDITADDEAIQDSQFHNHRQALRELIAAIRQTFPNLDMYWKSHTAMHIHRVADQKDWYHLDRVFYMSTSRSFDLYRYQRTIMVELNVTFLALYAATYLSVEQLLEGDGRHYTPAFNANMLSWFYDEM